MERSGAHRSGNIEGCDWLMTSLQTLVVGVLVELTRAGSSC